jgi:hypothetical protein
MLYVLQPLSECCTEQIGSLFKRETRQNCYTHWDKVHANNAMKEYIANKWQQNTPDGIKFDLLNATSKYHNIYILKFSIV